MSNIDRGNGEWQFIVKRNPAGVGTNTLFDKVPVGGTVTLDGPYGLAYLRTDSPRDIVLIGGGSGLAPVLSLARGAVAAPGLAGRAIHAFYGARGERDLCGADELKCLPGFGERLFFTQVVSEIEGFVHERVKKEFGGRFPELEFYFAGPPPMAEAVQRMLMDARVPYPQVHFDSFY
jgi:toluene monooxygenase electron transfer component